MKHHPLIKTCLIIAQLALTLAACAAPEASPGFYSGSYVLGGAHGIADGRVLPGVLVILDGEVDLAPGAVVAGPVYLLNGRLSLGGEVQGDLSQLGGELTVLPTAHIRGDLRTGSSQAAISPEAVVDGQVLSGPASGLDMDELFPNRSLEQEWVRLVIEAALLAGAAYLVTRFLPRPLERVQHAALHHPVIAAAMGLLAGVVGLIFIVVIAFTLILIPVTLLGVALGFLSIGFGWVAIGSALGRRLAAWRSRDPSPALSAAGTFVFVLGLNVLARLPFVGDWFYFAGVVIALGAVVLTRFGMRHFVPEPDEEYAAA